MYCIVFILGTVGNGLVIYVTGFRMKRTVNSVWFLNLALADFLFTAFLIFSIIYLSMDTWHFGIPMCKLHNFIVNINMFASVFLLTAISLDRCLSIWVVVWAQNKRTVSKVQLICLGIWIAAACCSIPYATIRTVSIRNGKAQCGYSGNTRRVHLLGLLILRVVLGFLIPFLVILVSYVAIGIRARRLQRTRSKRSRRIIFSIIFAFFICWLPFHIFSFIELIHTQNKNIREIITIGGPLSVALAFFNSCLNPILYVFMCEEFQTKLQQSICLVLESALAEDHLSFTSSRSLSSHFARITRKSDSTAPDKKAEGVTLTSIDSSKAVFTDETR